MRLSDRDIHAYLQDGSLVIVGPRADLPFDAYTQVQPCSIDLRLDSRFINVKDDVQQLDTKDLQRVWDFLDVVHVLNSETIVLRPHGILFGQIYEQLRIPSDVSGKVEGRSRIARLGLSVHASGDFINPEFEGAMPLQIINHNDIPIVIYPYMTICQLILVKLNSLPLVPYHLRDDSPYNREREAGTSVLHTDPVFSKGTREITLRHESERRLVDNYLKERETDKATPKGSRRSIGEFIMGDKYTVGQAGAVGLSSHAHDMTFNQIWNQASSSTDLSVLANELAQLRTNLKGQSTEPDHDVAVGEIASAEVAAQKRDGPTAMKHLARAGKWALDVATKIGVPVAAEALKKAMGL